MQKITACLWFDTEAEEAATFYTQLFDDAEILETARYGEAGPGAAGSVMLVRFRLAGQEFQALNGGPHFTFNEAVSFVIDCETQDEVDTYWAALSDGGQEQACGWVKDRYGLSWQVVPRILEQLVGGPDPAKGQAAMTAMLGMKKLDIAALQRAYDEG